MEELIHRIRDSANGGFPLTKEELEKIGNILEEVNENTSSNTSKLWEEFLLVYPKTTPKGRRLHVNKPSSKKKYEKIIKNNRKLHEKILILLKKEIEDKESQNALDYMPQIQTYINQRRWEAYDDEEGSDEGEFNIEIL